MSTTDRVLGQVKWFNNKAGYGFITTNDGESVGKDIFVHYTSISVTNSQYKYLTQGEYVEFKLEKSTSDKHELQANEVSGVNGGKLMCEVRRSAFPQDGERRPVRSYRSYTPADHESGEQDDDFKKVQRRRPAPNRKPRVDASAQA
jgi:cold shock CspA family protein